MCGGPLTTRVTKLFWCIGARVLGAGWCLLHAHDCSKIEHRWAVWTLAELFFFLLKKDGTKRLIPPSERLRVRYDNRQILGFDSEALGSCLIPDVQNCLI